MQEYFLKAEHVNKHYGATKALIDSGICCNRGEIHVLIGQNGAGKSTLVKIISGVVQKDSGSIMVDGKELDCKSAEDVLKYGIASVFQELTIIQELSVAENLFLGRELKNRFGRIDFKKMYQEAEKFLKQEGIDLHPRALAKDLNLCQKQMLEIAKALYKKPEILILDEATSALGKNEVDWLFAKMKQMADQNKLIIFISHRMDELARVANRATIFRDARYVMSFNWGELTDDEIVSYISGKENEKSEQKVRKSDFSDTVLELKNVAKGHVLKDINFSLHKGEILGIAGLSGHGQVELLHGMFGDQPFDTGKVIAGGHEVKIDNPRTALKNGIVLVPEDRKNDGLILSRAIGENMTMMSMDKMQKMGIIQKKAEKTCIRDSIKELSIKAPNPSLEVGSLSGGNQQKVVIAKALLTKADVVLLSDPTRGIDIGTKVEIYQLMKDLSDNGTAIVFYSTETSELIACCDRILIFYEGQIAAELSGDEITEANIIACSVGMGGKAQ